MGNMAKKNDILVIGGGAVGVAVAYYLAGQNRDVTLVEKNEICSGSSYGNAGLIYCQNPIPMATPGVIMQSLKWIMDSKGPLYIKPRLDLDLIKWLLRFRKACKEKNMRRTIELTIEMRNISKGLIADFTEKNHKAFTWENKGRLILYRTKEGLDEAQNDLKLLGDYGITPELLDHAGVKKKVPGISPNVLGAIYYADYSHVKPDCYVKALARLGEERGVNIITGTEVIGFETKQNKIKTVYTTRGDFQPDQVILSAGSYSPIISKDLGVKVPIQPAKGYSVTVKKPPNAPDLPVHLAEGRVAVTPMADYLRYSSNLELVGYDTSINHKRIRAATQTVNEYLTGMENPELIEIWSGFRPNTPDTLPIIERNDRYENLILATGHDMLGMTNSMITGLLVSQIVAGVPTEMNIDPFRLSRFS